MLTDGELAQGARGSARGQVDPITDHEAAILKHANLIEFHEIRVRDYPSTVLSSGCACYAAKCQGSLLVRLHLTCTISKECDPETNAAKQIQTLLTTLSESPNEARECLHDDNVRTYLSGVSEYRSSLVVC